MQRHIHVKLDLTYLKTFPQRFTQILCNLLHSDTTHSPHSKSTDQGVRVLAILDEGVDGHDGHIWLRLGVVHQVQVNKLLQL